MGKGRRLRAQRAGAKQQLQDQVAPANRINIQIPRPNVTTYTHIVVVPEFPPEHPLGGAKLSPSGSPGNYKVDVVLGIPGTSPSAFTETDWDRLSTLGDSLLEAPPRVVSLVQEWKTGGPGGPRAGSFEFKLNENRRIATGNTNIQANGFQDALAAAFDVLESYLSSLSFQYDIGAEAVAWRLTEENTGAVHFALKLLGKVKVIDTRTTLLTTPATRELLSTWRESMNAATPMAQALGLYKIIERVHHYRLDREARTRGTEQHYLPPRETMPSSTDDVVADYADASDNFTPYLGTKFTKVWNDDLRGRIRNAIAHLLEDAPSLTPDRSADVNTCREAIPILHYIARTMLRAEIADQPNWPELYTKDE